MNPARFSTQSFFDSQLRDSSFCMFYKLPFARIYLRRIGKYFYFVSSIAWDPPPWWGKKKKSAGAQSSIFFPSRVSSRFLLVRSLQGRYGRVPHDEGWFSQSVKTSQKVGKGLTIRKVMGGREIFKPQEFFSLSNSLYEFFLGHSMKFLGGIFLI